VLEVSHRKPSERGQSLTRSTEVCGRPLPRCRCFSAFFVRPSPFSLKLLLQIAKVDDALIILALGLIHSDGC